MEVPGQTGEDQLQEAEALMAKTLRRITLDFCEELCHMLALRSDPRPLVSRNAESADFTIYWPKDEFAQLRVQHDGKVARVNFGELEEDFDEPTDKPVLFFAVKENPKDWIVIGEEAFVDLKAARQIIAQRFGLEDFEVRRLQPVSGDVGLISSLCDAVDNSVLSDIMPEEDSEDSLEVQKNFLLYMLKVQTILFLHDKLKNVALKRCVQEQKKAREESERKREAQRPINIIKGEIPNIVLVATGLFAAQVLQCVFKP